MFLMGMMASCITIVFEAPLQQCHSVQWSLADGQIEDLVLVTAGAHGSVQWWNNLLQGRPFLDPIQQITITKECFRGGLWEVHFTGGTVDVPTVKGMLAHQQGHHINYVKHLDKHLALRAAFRSLRAR